MLDKTAAPEALERSESDEGQEVENFDLPAEGRRGLLHRFAPRGWSVPCPPQSSRLVILVTHSLLQPVSPGA